MATADKPGRQVFPDELARLESIIERFETAWQQGNPPTIDEYLNVQDVEPRRLVIELAHVDLECRLKAGQAARVEAYFERYADLAGDRAAALGLIEAEYQLRRRREPALAPDEYMRRFPQYREHLAERLRGPHPAADRFPSRLTCPHCSRSIALDKTTAGEDVTCPACGASFRLDLDEPPAPSPDGPPRLGPFELLETVGQGAFGTVYRARDTELNRLVAVKVPRGGRTITPADVQRIVREARSAARLSHPGIVPVYEVSRGAPVPYIVSAYIAGPTLAEVLQQERLSFHEAADIAAQVAEALEHAHQHGVVHRDLKPSNIILGQIEGSQVKNAETGVAAEPPQAPERLTLRGRAFVMDFGLARRDEGEVRVTLDGQILGTPAYMSPEQARGQSHQVDGRSDVHSLGVIFYEMLTGELPFRGVARMVLQQILNDEPRSPRQLNDRIPRDLETITLKCLAKEPGRRYPTAGALAADLRRYLRGEPIAARPVGRVERLWRWSKRNPRVAGLSGLVLLLLMTLAIGSLVFAVLTSRQRDAVAEARDQAEMRLEQSLQTLDILIYDVQEHLSDQPALLTLKKRVLQTALGRLKQVKESARGTNGQHSLASAEQQVGDIYLMLGQTAKARKHYENCLEVATRLAAMAPLNPQEKHAVCISTMNLGIVSLRTGAGAKAQAYYRKAVALAQQMVQDYPRSSPAKLDLVRCYNQLGNLDLQQGNARAAAKAHEQAVGLARSIGSQATAVKQQLAQSYSHLGDAQLRMGQVPAAEQAYGQALSHFVGLAKTNPDSPRGKKNLAITNQKLGDIQMYLNRTPMAQKYYAQALTNCEDLIEIAPLNRELQRDLAVVYGKLGETYTGLGDDRLALLSYSKALERLNKLSKGAPEDVPARRDVLMTYEKLGDAHLALGEIAAARAAQRQAREGFEKLAGDDPNNVDMLANLAAANGKSGQVEKKANQFAMAARFFSRGLAILQDLTKRGKIKDQPQYQNWLRDQQIELAVCAKAPKAIQDLGFTLAQPWAERAQLAQMRARILAGRGDHAATLITAEKLRELAPTQGDNLYEVVCCYALAAAAVAPGKRPEQLSPVESAARAKYAQCALQGLTEAVRCGFKNAHLLQSDPDLAAIRSEEGYKQLVKSLTSTK